MTDIRYVAIDRRDLTALRRLVQVAMRDSEDTRFIEKVSDALRDLEVLKLTAAIERETSAGHLVFQVKDASEVR